MSEVILDISREEAGITVQLGGEIDLHRTPKFHQQLAELCAEKPARLILDLSQVNYIDSSGVGSLVEIFRRLKKEDRKMILVNPSDRVCGVLEITRLDQFFTIVETTSEAKTL